LTTYLQIALIITSLALITSIVLQNKGVGLGGLTGQDMNTVFSARRGIEKTLFTITVVLAIVFIALVITTIAVAK
jgi:preprotein translocase subunit SecG